MAACLSAGASRVDASAEDEIAASGVGESWVEALASAAALESWTRRFRSAVDAEIGGGAGTEAAALWATAKLAHAVDGVSEAALWAATLSVAGSAEQSLW